jgi:hypothetical protein
MSDEPKRRWSGAWVGWMAVVAAVFIAYIVALGPAYHAWGGAALQHPAYAPLIFASRYRPIGQAVIWYLNRCHNSGGVPLYSERDGVVFVECALTPWGYAPSSE